MLLKEKECDGRHDHELEQTDKDGNGSSDAVVLSMVQESY